MKENEIEMTLLPRNKYIFALNLEGMPTRLISCVMQYLIVFEAIQLSRTSRTLNQKVKEARYEIIPENNKSEEHKYQKMIYKFNDLQNDLNNAYAVSLPEMATYKDLQFQMYDLLRSKKIELQTYSIERANVENDPVVSYCGTNYSQSSMSCTDPIIGAAITCSTFGLCLDCSNLCCSWGSKDAFFCCFSSPPPGCTDQSLCRSDCDGIEPPACSEVSCCSSEGCCNESGLIGNSILLGSVSLCVLSSAVKGLYTIVDNFIANRVEHYNNIMSLPTETNLWKRNPGLGSKLDRLGQLSNQQLLKIGFWANSNSLNLVTVNVDKSPSMLVSN